MLRVLVALAALVAGTARAEPRFDPGPCPPSVGTVTGVRCGSLTVPERRTRPNGRSVRLAVAIVAAPAARPGAEPLLYVTGGPGLASLPNVARFLAQPIVTDRDLVLVDLRGTGSSEPSLACPEVDDRVLLGATAGDRVARGRDLDAVRACRRRLRIAGVDLRAYDYTEMAADLADLRRALGVPRWSVYGISNGGRLALELVRRHPDGIRSLVLDAALPPQGNFYLELWPHAQRAFDTLFAACAGDATCAHAHPDLAARFRALVERLNASPVSATVPDPVSGRPVTLVFDDARALGTLRNALYDTDLIPLIPTLLDALADGTGFELVASAIVERLDGPDTFSLGQQMSDNCREEQAFVPRRAAVRQARQLPQLAAAILDRTDADRCRVWHVGRADPLVNRPVRSDVPALLLVGGLDPVHPRESSEAIARFLGDARLVELPGLGHGTVDAHPCPRRLMQAFLADPAAPLDTSCVDDMTNPAFLP